MLLQRRVDGQFETIETVATAAKQESYILIKTISHYIVRLHLVVEAILKGEIALVQITRNLEPLRSQLSTFKTNYLHHVKTELPVIDLSLRMIENLSDCTSLNEVEVLSKHYTMEMESHHERYGRQATERQLRSLDNITSRWLELYAVNLRSTYIIMVGARGPKKDLVEMQYFKSLRAQHGLADKKSSRNGTIYSEMLPEQMDVTIQVLLHDLARDLVNQDVGEGMLNNREAMNEDILGRHAKSILSVVKKPTLGASLWLGFWGKQQPDEKAKSKCPFHR